MFLIQCVMKAIIQIIRNKMRKVYAKILARCRQKAVLRGALPGGGFLCHVGWTYLYHTVPSLLLGLGQQL